MVVFYQILEGVSHSPEVAHIFHVTSVKFARLGHVVNLLLGDEDGRGDGQVEGEEEQIHSHGMGASDACECEIWFFLNFLDILNI